MLTHGIDLHKRDLVIATVDAEGAEVKQKRVRACEADVLRYFSTLSGPHRAVVESTGSGYWLADLCAAQNIALTLAHARKLKAISAAKVKTDRVDSLTLAQLLRADLIPEAHMISPELRPLRDVLRARLRLVEKRSSCLNSIARLLEKYNVDSAASLPPWAQLQAACQEEQIELLTRQIKRLVRSLLPQRVPNEDVQRLLWVPGVGKITAFTLYLEIDGIDRFPTERDFFSYCRLVPGADNSGGRVRHKRSKEGNRYLKTSFQQRRGAGGSVLSRDQSLRAEESAQEEPLRRPCDHRQGDRAHRLPRAQGADRLQRSVQGSAALPNQAVAVATPGKPHRPTGSLGSHPH
jgi:transposase